MMISSKLFGSRATKAAAILCAALMIISVSGTVSADTAHEPSSAESETSVDSTSGSNNTNSSANSGDSRNSGNSGSSNGSENSGASDNSNRPDSREDSDNGNAINTARPLTHVTEEEALSEMKEYASNEKLSLMVNEESGTFAVKDLASGNVIWSNPYDADGDEYTASASKREELKSALLINAVKVSDTDAAGTVIRSANSVSGAHTSVSKTENGFRAEVEFPVQGIKVPYYVTLLDDCFEVSLAVSEIYETEFDDPENAEDSTASIVDLDLFPNLYAAYADEEGYFVIPDGSGALIDFNNGKRGCAEYSQKIFGRDYSKVLDVAPAKTEQAYFPILGIVKENEALLEVVTEGAAYASVRASVAGQRATGYNAGGFQFSLRTSDRYFMGAINTSALRAYEQTKIPEERVTVRYYPIAKQNASYMDIIERYRGYLLEEGLMTKKSSEGVPLYIDLYGGTIKERSVAGFPFKLRTAATTYSQAQTILEELKERGVDNLIVTYNDFNDAGLTERISNGADIAGTLGGEKEFKALRDYCYAEGITLALSADLMEYARSGGGFSKTGDAVIGVAKSYSTQGEFELAFGTPHPTRRAHFILAPGRFEDAYDQYISGLSAVGAAAVSTANSTSILYSDFRQSENRNTSRQQTIEILKKCYERIKESNFTFVTSACNEYALKYADYIRGVPLSSSGFDITDRDIPLYEILIHGYIPYSSAAINASSTGDEMLLKSLVTGTPPHYDLMSENPNKFTDSSYDTLYYTHADGYFDTAAQTYKLFSERLSDLINSPITEFEIVSDNMWECKFENGAAILVDFKNYTAAVNGKIIELPPRAWKGAVQ